MLNPIAALRAYMALNEAVVTVKTGPKPGVYSTEFWTMIFSVLTIVYEGSKGVIPPEYSVYGMLGMSALYIIVRFVLKMKHQDLPVVPQLENPAVQSYLQSLLDQATAAAALAKTAAADKKVQVEADVKAAQAADAAVQLP